VKIRRTGATRFDIICVPALLEIDHGHARSARRLQHLGRLRNDVGRARNIEASYVEIAAGGGIGILHVDDDNRRLVDGDADRLGSRRQGDDAVAVKIASDAHFTRHCRLPSLQC